MVPKGWKLSTIGEHVELLTGFPFESQTYTDFTDDVRLLRGDNVGQGFLRWRDAKRWPAAQTSELTRYFLQRGDFVIAMDRTWIPSGVKISEVSKSDLPCLLVQRVCRLRAKSSLDQRLLRQWFSGHRFEQYVKKVQTETAVPHISPADIREFPILLPPLQEQVRIAEILTAWDRSIETVDKLIQNSEAQKRSLMQRVLTGERRLPGFNRPWVAKTVNSLGAFRKGNGLRRDDIQNHGLPCILYGDLYTKYEYVARTVTSFISATLAESSQPIRKGDLLFTVSGETADEIGKCVAYLGDPVAYAGGDLLIQSPTNDDSEFLGYLLNHESIIRQKARLAQGHSVVHINAKSLGSIPLKLPDRDEQRAVASILSLADRTIKNYVLQRRQLADQKEALMQRLLTGKLRVEAVEAA
jgi:type I restriction enzyme S subunit